VRLIRGSREEHGRKTYLYCRFAIKKRFDYTFQAPDENEKVVYDFSLHRNPVFLIFAVGISKNSKENFATIDGNSLSNPFGRGSRIVIQLIPSLSNSYNTGNVNYHGSRRYFTNNRTTLGIKFYVCNYTVIYLCACVMFLYQLNYR